MSAFFFCNILLPGLYLWEFRSLFLFLISHFLNLILILYLFNIRLYPNCFGFFLFTFLVSLLYLYERYFFFHFYRFHFSFEDGGGPVFHSTKNIIYIYTLFFSMFFKTQKREKYQSSFSPHPSCLVLIHKTSLVHTSKLHFDFIVCCAQNARDRNFLYLLFTGFSFCFVYFLIPFLLQTTPY